MTVISKYAIAIATLSDWFKNLATCTRNVSRALSKLNEIAKIWIGLINKLMSVFHASARLLIMNCVITLSKWLWIHEAIAIH